MIIKKSSQNPISGIMLAFVNIAIAVFLFGGMISRGSQILLGCIFCLLAIEELMKVYLGYLEWKLERQLMQFISDHAGAILSPPPDDPDDKDKDKKEIPS